MHLPTIPGSPVRHRAFVVACHCALTVLAYLGAYALRFDLAIPAEAFARCLETLPYLLVLRLGASHYFRLDRGYWQHVGLRDLFQLTAAATVGSVLFPAALLLFGTLEGIPPSVFVLDWVLVVALMAGVRVVARVVRERARPVPAARGQRTFIIGAGVAGERLLRHILHGGPGAFDVVGLIDDDPAKRGRSLHDVSVLGTAEQLSGLVALYDVRAALIAVPSATPAELRRLVDRCTDARVDVKILPPTLTDLVPEDVSVSGVRDVQVNDLLGREPVRLDLNAVGPDLAGKVVVVTGAGGSIGSELARQIAQYHPLQLVLIDRAESPLYFIQLEISQANPAVGVVPVLASVTNADRLRRVFERYRPDCVFHAAAYKHVPLLEGNLVEGVWNNVVGTLCVARSAARTNCGKFVLISTDKAVKPTSVLGVTKLIAERIVRELPSLRDTATDFRVVRFGNVLNSDGSVLPLFRRQLAAGGPLTVTHPEVRRYFMTIPEAVQLVLQATALPEAAGRIALLEMGTQVRIVDLAEQLIRLAGLIPHKDVDIVFTGLRPGEKLEEELFGPDEQVVETSVDKIRLVERTSLPAEGLARRLRRLIQVAAGHDEVALRRVLSALAPEYQPPLHEFVLAAINGNGNGHGNGNGNGNGNGHRRGQRPPAARRSGATLALTLPARRVTGGAA